MLKNHKLLIDAYCPMCTIYGKCFTSFGLVDKNTVSPFQIEFESNELPVNMEKAKSEIALFNSETKKTDYGIDAFITILGHNKPRIKAILKSRMVYFVLRSLYAFISANRKVITRPVALNIKDTCVPRLAHSLRLAFILICTLGTALLLQSYTSELFAKIGWTNPWYLETLICFGQLGFQVLVFKKLYGQNFWDYLGHMATISLLGALTLFAISKVLVLSKLSLFVLLPIFFSVILAMFLEHILRSHRLGYNWSLTASWVIYRSIVLLILILVL